MKDLTYIGIGASAGGLKAFEQLLPLLPVDKEYVYIIAQHLDPLKTSALSEILTRYTTLDVIERTKDTVFMPKTIYVIPAGFDLVLQDKKLLLEEVAQKTKHTSTPSIDKLFTTLALYKKEKSVAILLTGAGHDGREGIQKIKEYHGITIAQDPKEAHYSSMPQSAIDSGYVDYVLRIKEIGHTLSSIEHPEIAAPFAFIKDLLYKQTSLNIEKYKEETIFRRINKRMLLLHIEDMNAYVQYIKSNQEETQLLYENILIGVTEFFRDTDSFDTLKEEIYLYLKDKPENYEVKVWSIACSTGEEAYSLAILIDQVSQKLQKKFYVKIFASDIDVKALAKARVAIYSQEAVNTLDKKMLSHYFTKVENAYKVINQIRNNIVFTQHNVLSDPPFINQDIVSCRNFLIYIKPEIQQEIFTLLHYSLKDDGLLFLGSSESTLLSVKYFDTLNSEHKIYVKEKLKNPPKLSHHFFSKHLQENGAKPVHDQSIKQDLDIDKQIIQTMVEHLIPNCIVVDKEMSIVYKKGSLAYVALPDGFMTLNIIEHLHTSLKYAVRKLITLVFKENVHHTTQFIEVSLTNGTHLYVKILAYPYHKENTTMVLLYFQELHTGELIFDTTNLNLPEESFLIESLSAQSKQLQDENHILDDKLTIYKENMQLLNEELQSSNEELQSSNEELETSNEELQSSNEELHTSILNETKLQEKLIGILNATQNGIVGLDLKGNHTFVNDATCKLLGFSKEELIANNAHKLWHHTKADGSHFPKNECKIHQHLTDRRSLRTQDLFWRKDGTSIEVEVLQNPLYENKKVIGAVLSFEDITAKNRLKKEAKHEHKITELYLNTIGTLLMTLDLEGNISMINAEGAKLLGASQKELLGKNWFENFLPQNVQKEVKKVFHSVISGSISLTRNYTNAILDTNKKEHTLFWTNHYTKDNEGNITGLITSGIDITKEEEISKKLFKQEHLYKMTFEEANIGIAHISLDEKWIDTNEYMSELLGYTKEEFLSMNISDITYKDDINLDNMMLRKLLHNEKENYHLEKRYIHKNGSIVWVSLSVVLLKDEQNEPLYFLKIIRDISELKLLMYTLEAEKNKFETMLNFTPTPIILYDDDGQVLMLNKKYQEVTGYSLNEPTTIDNLINIVFKNANAKALQKIKAYYKNPTLEKDVEQIITTLSGEKRVGILNAVAINDNESNAKTLYLVAIVDITDLQKKDELMIAQSRQAAMGDMLAMIAHQWRQPLSVISMLANNVKLKIELEEDVTKEELEHLTSSLEKQTQYLSHTIDDFRDFFKPDKMKELVSIDTIVQKVENLMLKSLQNNNITLHVPKTSEIKIEIFMNQLIQVLINLINNAKDAIKSKAILEGEITINAIQKNNKITISVCDNGGGIDKAIKHKLGAAYVSTKSKNGTGLGLYMSIMIVENHLGGTLDWTSDNKGSCFNISLPSDS